MATFQYKAVAASGEVTSGRLEAPDQPQAVAQLRRMGLMPIRADEVGGAPLAGLSLERLAARRDPNRLGSADVTALTRQLATLLGAGIELDRALQVVVESTDREPVRALVARVKDRIREGGAFSAALEREGRTFSRLYLNMVRAGEAAGALDTVMVRLADYLERTAEVRARVVNSLIYPVILLAFAGLSVLVMLTFVLPRFETLFADMDAQLPGITRVVMSIAGFIRSWGWLAALIAAFGLWQFGQARKDPARRLAIDRWVLSLPLAGPLACNIDTARFCRTLGTLLANGVALLPALNITRETLTNALFIERTREIAETVKHGGRLSQAVADAGVFPKQAVHMIQVGEESGQIEPMLERCAELYDRDTELAIQRGLTVFQPALIVVLAIIISVIIMSLILAILAINDLPF